MLARIILFKVWIEALWKFAFPLPFLWRAD